MRPPAARAEFKLDVTDQAAVEAAIKRIAAAIDAKALSTVRMANAALAFAAKTLADQYAGSGVTVNVVNPSKVTDMPTTELANFGPGECTPQDVADAVAFLASDLAGSISGESIATGHKARGVATY